MVALPHNATMLKIEAAIEDKEVISAFRPYLGISGIANDCSRDLWYNFRLCSLNKFDPRTERLLQRGHNEEPLIIADLVKAGVIVYGDQDECVTGHGHIKGHCDGRAINIPDAPKTEHLLEFKTANTKNFQKFKKLGVQEAHPVYYGQLVCYMYLLKITRALFIVVNKDNDERYYERVHANNKYAKELLDKGLDIISTEIAPTKAFGPDWYRCKWCNNYEACHHGGDIHKTCRSCQMCDIHDDGEWRCSKYKMKLSFEQQQLGCDKYQLLMGLR